MSSERFTISLERALAEAFDQWISRNGYHNRSEAVRDLLRNKLEEERLHMADADQYCVASLSYLYDHRERELASRLARLHHEHHALSISTQTHHLDHDYCMACTILRGPLAEVQALSRALLAENGVRHGQLNLITLFQSEHGHKHDGHHHFHYQPRN